MPIGSRWVYCGKKHRLNENWVQDPLEIAQILHAAMTDLAIPYFICGGVATLIHGEPRTTMDLDIVAQIKRQDLARVVTLLEAQGFYCGRLLTVTHSITALSADIAMMQNTDHARSEMSRRQLINMGREVSAWFCSPEDLILAKLQCPRRTA
jgi:hypothetical protein